MEEKEDYTPPVFEKTEAERAYLKGVFMKNMLTKRLNEEDMNTLIMATRRQTFKTGETLIKFGEEGTEYILLETGVVECQVYDEEGEVINTKTITEGAAFGELSLLYNCPRSATITSLTDC